MAEHHCMNQDAIRSEGRNGKKRGKVDSLISKIISRLNLDLSRVVSLK